MQKKIAIIFVFIGLIALIHAIDNYENEPVAGYEVRKDGLYRANGRGRFTLVQGWNNNATPGRNGRPGFYEKHTLQAKNNAQYAEDDDRTINTYFSDRELKTLYDRRTYTWTLLNNVLESVKEGRNVFWTNRRTSGYFKAIDSRGTMLWDHVESLNPDLWRLDEDGRLINQGNYAVPGNSWELPAFGTVGYIEDTRDFNKSPYLIASNDQTTIGGGKNGQNWRRSNAITKKKSNEQWFTLQHVPSGKFLTGYEIEGTNKRIHLEARN